MLSVASENAHGEPTAVAIHWAQKRKVPRNPIQPPFCPALHDLEFEFLFIFPHGTSRPAGKHGIDPTYVSETMKTIIPPRNVNEAQVLRLKPEVQKFVLLLQGNS